MKNYVVYFRDCFDLGPSVMSLMVNFAIGNFMITLMSLCQGSTIYNIGKFEENNYLNLLIKYKVTKHNKSVHDEGFLIYTMCKFQVSNLQISLIISGKSGNI